MNEYDTTISDLKMKVSSLIIIILLPKNLYSQYAVELYVLNMAELLCHMQCGSAKYFSIIKHYNAY